MEFDVNRFDEYREDNRLEAKKAKDSLQMSSTFLHNLVRSF